MENRTIQFSPTSRLAVSIFILVNGGGERGGGTGIYDRILARWLDASIDWVAIELNTGAGGNGQSFLDRVYEIHGC